ncbi:STAS domain-containing protein [Calditerrivibrio nitroreducens]|uniref:Sulfate transporter/antisigma-factor antagonist STAS n=1 Tax=Calditerrivibrio nitroreducens (strain DSM 19672 / NBRC 101217 / Yu37-1) TaxID=768670 RepID=E4TIF7_CALNY|nr:STAS domain-containing protein [Calditerrivibrio nitroreducens]ADR17982.1 Sulfate transporter/antisigma-factor antagonist STAS [Calditerrivibrio nitroreducens DSM 19672]
MLEFVENEDYIVARVNIRRIDVSNVDEINSLLAKIDDKKDLILDVCQLQFIDSSGIGIITGLYKKYKKNGRIFGLLGVNSRIASLLNILGLTGIVKIFCSIEDYLRVKK